MKSIRKVIFTLLFATLFLGGICISTSNSQASELSHRREVRAKVIAKVSIKGFKKYHVYPSVAIGQAIVESGCGDACRRYNYWGIMSNKYDFSTLEKGTLSYLKLLNKGWYGSIAACDSASEQIEQIANHGYCQPSNGYAGKVKRAISIYNLKKYDKQLKKYIKKQEEKAKEKRRIAKEKRRIAKEKKKREEMEKERKRSLAMLAEQRFILKYDPVIPTGKIGIDLNGVSKYLKVTDTLILQDHYQKTNICIVDIFDFEANKVTPIHKYNQGKTYSAEDSFLDGIFLYTSDIYLARKYPLVNLIYVEDAKG
jgi:hypothetical protein